MSPSQEAAAPHPFELAIAALTETRTTDVVRGMTSEHVAGRWLGNGQYEHEDALCLGVLEVARNLLNLAAAGAGTSPEALLRWLALNVAREIPNDGSQED